MKILNTKKGFTTNSSGSYEWIPGVTSSTTPKTSTSTETTTPSYQPIQFSEAPRETSLGDIIILPISIIAGLIALSIIIKEIINTNKKEEKRKRKKSKKK